MKMEIILESVRVALAYREHYIRVVCFTCYQVIVNVVDLGKYYVRLTAKGVLKKNVEYNYRSRLL